MTDTDTPILTGQDIGMAHYATRAVLETVLADLGITFVNSVTMNVLTNGGGTADRDAVVQQVAFGLKIDAVAALESLDQLVAKGLVASPPDRPEQVELTPAGRALHQQVQAAVAQIVERLYGGLAPEDLATTKQVLSAVTERANAELAP